MAKILKEKVENISGVKWLRTHAVDSEGNTLCFNPEYEPELEEGIGQITCVDCVEIIKICKTIEPNDLTPEHGNEMFHKRAKS
jgi:hypothetical protein